MTVWVWLLAGLTGLLRGLVLVLAVVHELADWRLGHGGHLDKIEVGLRCESQGVLHSDDPDLLAIGADKPDLRNPDAVVDAWFFADVAPPSLRWQTERRTWLGQAPADHRT